MNWRFFLESSGKDSRLPRFFRLSGFPVVLGRHPDCDVRLNVDRVSRMHARIDLRGDRLTIEDLASTNGTFVNRRRIEQPTALAPGDVIHFADHEFRVMREKAHSDADAGPGDATMIGLDHLPQDFSLKTPAFFELLDHAQVVGHCQPIVTATGEPFGLELLGRSLHPELQEGPDELFELATALECEVRLSRLLRRRCFEDASRSGISSLLFFNNHPAECEDPEGLIAELASLRAAFPELRLMFEVHEAAVTDPGVMTEIRRALEDLDIGLAYDDFGAGQARMLELADIPPDVLKFDKSLVQDIGSRNSPRFRLLDKLNNMVAELGVKTLAEGVEDERTARLCREIGIDYLQGFHFGHPSAIAPDMDFGYHQSEKESAP